VNDRDSLLICNKDNSQDVKKIIEHLKENKRIESLYHSKVFRPWGWYINIEGNDNSRFKVKRIAVYPGKRLSLQSHNHRSEHWVIVNGNALVQVGNNFYNLTKDDHIYIPLKELHRIENTGNELMEFTETQIGDYLGEDDIIRYEDDFGRI
jgi:mannose-6-phosphate isomerase-like protein (cupin superfamily)